MDGAALRLLRHKALGSGALQRPPSKGRPPELVGTLRPHGVLPRPRLRHTLRRVGRGKVEPGRERHQRRQLRSLLGRDVDFDQCRLGLSTVKPTKILFSSHAVGFNELRGLKCDHPKGSHESTAGKRTRDATGERWASRAQGEYPPHLCQVVAHSLFQGIRQRALETEHL